MLVVPGAQDPGAVGSLMLGSVVAYSRVWLMNRGY